MSAVLNSALSVIPVDLRAPLIEEFDGILHEYRAGRWEAVGLKAGKLCEIVYTIISGHIAGSYPAKPSKPKNMVAACQALEQAGSTYSRSARIQIPRLLIAMYELRNNRSIGHVGGDVDPNHMDAELFLRAAKWLVAELIRVFTKLDVNAARDLIESITERTLPVIWEREGLKRVLNPSLSARDKALILAYSSPNGISSRDLAAWSDYGNLSRFRSTVLAGLHKMALIHFDRHRDVVIILPTGIRHVETSGMLTLK